MIWGKFIGEVRGEEGGGGGRNGRDKVGRDESRGKRVGGKVRVRGD